MNHRHLTLFAAVVVVSAAGGRESIAQEADFLRHVKPVLESACLSCHGPEKPKGGLRLDTKTEAFKGGDGGPSIVPGKPEESSLYTLTVLPADHDDIMPPKGDTLSKDQTEKLRDWIKKGAVWPDDAKLTQVRRVNFVKDIQPILELNCVACHREGYAKGGVHYDTREAALSSGDNGPSLVPWHPEKSTLYTTTILAADDDDLMPPAAKGGPLSKEITELLRDWIAQGAAWPEGLALQPRKPEEGLSADNAALTAELHRRIVENHKVSSPAEMQLYTNAIPGGGVNYVMVPIPAGEFLMGSPASEPGRNPDEGPQHKVAVDAFWMGKFEVSWNEYELFMYPDERQRGAFMADAVGLVEAVSRPTRPYVEMSFGMGKQNFPAISMTQHAANKYCQWLSAKTGHFYRLPTEAEWEYACRAGTTTAYHFGDDPSALKEYAWFEENSNWKYQKVGLKKPNPWGLHDMHGNVAEWTLDQYDPNYYKQFEGIVAQNPWNRATKPYPHVVKGGSWEDPPALLRSAVRRASDPSWKVQDPQLPKSIWFHTDAQFLGFRIVRPLKVPPAEELHKYWTSGVEKD